MHKTKDAEAALAFEERQEAWIATHIKPVAAAMRAWAEKREGGQPPAARVYLRDVAAHCERFTTVALDAMVMGAMGKESLAATATTVAAGVAKACGKPFESNERQIQVGYAIVSIVCEVTGAAAIVDKHGDRPEKVAGGVRLTPVYELQNKSGAFFEEAAEFGAVGMPTFMAGEVPAWTSQKHGGVEGQEDSGMVHSAGQQMRGVLPGNAPALYDAVNIAQRAAFKVNPVTANVIKGYDAAKAQAWLLERLLSDGMEPAKAEAKARELARL